MSSPQDETLNQVVEGIIQARMLMPQGWRGVHALDGAPCVSNGAVALFWERDIDGLPEYEPAPVVETLRVFARQSRQGREAGTWPIDLPSSTCDTCAGAGKRPLMKSCSYCGGEGVCECPTCGSEHECGECDGSGDSREPSGETAACGVCKGLGRVFVPVRVAGTQIDGFYAHLLGQLPGIVPVASTEPPVGGAPYLSFRFSGGCGTVMEFSRGDSHEQ